MANATVTFDHNHVISQDPAATAGWYVDKLGGSITRTTEVGGAPQIYVAFGDGAMVIVRGKRTGESVGAKSELEWGIDHFGMRVHGDFDGFCAGLRAKGVQFSMEPTVMNPTTRIAFINAPDGVSIELLERKNG
jgi:catechol 2,3-dioxygenase-like lactoylglutathione lyase family enzyme